MFNELAKEIHQNAVDHGWWDESRTFGEIVALCHSELSEALEEYRAGRSMLWKACMTAEKETPCIEEGCGDWMDGKCELTCLSPKPEGIAVEMADCIIRILDWAGKENIDMDVIIREKMDYNKTRTYRHGGKVI